MMTARLKGHVGGCAFRFLTGHTQRMHFRMRFTGTVVEAFTDNFALIYNHAANARVRMGGESPTLRQLQGARHIHLIVHSLIL